MRPGWVAAAVRARGLARRRLGRDGCSRLASAAWPDAVSLLRSSPYGRALPESPELAAAQHAVRQTAAWHLRVLAGWLPPAGVEQLRALTAGLELHNLLGRVAECSGGAPGEVAPPVDLGHLAVAWGSARHATTMADLRRRLAVTPWGDPGGGGPAAIEAALRLAWSRRVDASVPTARAWARSAAVIVVARERLLFGRALSPSAVADADRMLGPAWRAAATVGDLAGAVPLDERWPLAEVTRPGDLWRSEVAWRRRVLRDATLLVRRGRLDAASVVGVVTLLLADAEEAVAALDAAARPWDPGRPRRPARLVEVRDAVA